MTSNKIPDATATKIKFPALAWNAQNSEVTTTKLYDRLSVWLLVGNATGLLLCFNAALDGKICAWPSFRVTALEFGVGAAAVLIAHILTGFSYSWKGALEQMKAVNRDLVDYESRVHAHLIRLFSFILGGSVLMAFLCFLCGFATLIHAPLALLLNPNADSLFCPR